MCYLLCISKELNIQEPPRDYFVALSLYPKAIIKFKHLLTWIVFLYFLQPVLTTFIFKYLQYSQNKWLTLRCRKISKVPDHLSNKVSLVTQFIKSFKVLNHECCLVLFTPCPCWILNNKNYLVQYLTLSTCITKYMHKLFFIHNTKTTTENHKCKVQEA